MDVKCEVCGSACEVAATGRPRRFCSNACRQKSYRDRAVRVPVRLRRRHAWVRAAGKRPIRPDGSPASSTDARTWGSWAEVQSGAGDGFGIMLGDGLGCYDLDRVSDAEVREFLGTVSEPVVFVERSVSGRGVHVFVEADEAPGWRRNVGGLSVEFYSRGRFIRMTGVSFSS